MVFRFKKEKSGIAQYFVSINGFPETECGSGNDGLAVAVGVLTYVRMKKSSVEVAARTLAHLEKEAKKQGAILLERVEKKPRLRPLRTA
jgi:hypothetical protein